MCVCVPAAAAALMQHPAALGCAHNGDLIACLNTIAGRVLKLIRSLVMGGGGGSCSVASTAGWVTSWDWVTGWQWVTHAMEVYGVDWRTAAGLA